MKLIEYRQISFDENEFREELYKNTYKNQTLYKWKAINRELSRGRH